MKYLIAALLLLPTSAFAQVQPAGNTPLEQALGAKLMQEINNGLQCSAAQVTLGQQLQAAQAKIAELQKQIDAKEPPK